VSSFTPRSVSWLVCFVWPGGQRACSNFCLYSKCFTTIMLRHLEVHRGFVAFVFLEVFICFFRANKWWWKRRWWHIISHCNFDGDTLDKLPLPYIIHFQYFSISCTVDSTQGKVNSLLRTCMAVGLNVTTAYMWPRAGICTRLGLTSNTSCCFTVFPPALDLTVNTTSQGTCITHITAFNP